MSDSTNIVTKFKQFMYNAGVNSANVEAAVNHLFDVRICVAVPSGTDGNARAAAANDTIVVPIDANYQLIGCNISAATAIANTAGDDIVVTVKTNGVTCATYNSNAAAQGAIAANAVGAMSLTTANSFVDAGESITISYTMADNTNNFLDGIVILTLRPQ